jgi:hypothetical protein
MTHVMGGAALVAAPVPAENGSPKRNLYTLAICSALFATRT